MKRKNKALIKSMIMMIFITPFITHTLLNLHAEHSDTIALYGFIIGMIYASIYSVLYDCFYKLEKKSKKSKKNKKEEEIIQS